MTSEIYSRNACLIAHTAEVFSGWLGLHDSEVGAGNFVYRNGAAALLVLPSCWARLGMTEIGLSCQYLKP